MIYRALSLAALAACGMVAARQYTLVRRACVLCQAEVEPFAHAPASPRARILVVGDSTGVGVGCDPQRESIPALIADDHPGAAIVNRCRSGATIADAMGSLQGEDAPQGRFDLAIVFAGGNDVLRRTGGEVVRRNADELLSCLQHVARRVVWVGIANAGLAPLFLPPLSWWVSWRAKRINRLLGKACDARGATFLNFYRARGVDPFSREPQRFYARDGVHPSGTAYAWSYRAMKAALALDQQRS